MFMSKSSLKSSTKSRRHRIILIGALLAVGNVASGCSAIDRLSQIGETPKLNAIENPTAQPGYKPVSMPMPKPETVSYNANSLWRNGSRSFFKDQRAHQIGDLLTVTVNITDQANFANETQRNRTSKEAANLNDFAGSKLLSGNLAKVVPGALLNTDSTSQFDGKGSIQRQESLTTNVAAVVTQMLPNGNLVVEGKQERQHHRFHQDRAGPHLLWRPRPDLRLPAAALRPTGDRRAAAVLIVDHEKLVPDLIRDGNRFSEKIMPK